MKEQSIAPESEILKSLEGVRVDKLENVFTPQPTDDELWDEFEKEMYEAYLIKLSCEMTYGYGNVYFNKIHELKSKFKITRR
jgi:hypothetical protein